MAVAGSTVRLTYQTLVNGVATNAATVQVTVQKPDGTLDGPYTLAAAQVVRVAAGNYRYDYPTSISAPGEYVALWQSNISTVRDEISVTRAYTPSPAAWARLSRMVAADTTPKLTDDDLDALISIATRPDGTLNLRRAAAEGWRWKAARVAGGFTFSADGVAVDKSMLLDHCLQMVRQYTSGVRTVTADSGLSPFETDFYTPAGT